MAEAEVLLQDIISPFGGFTGSDLQVTAFSLQLWQQSHQIEQRSSDPMSLQVDRVKIAISFQPYSFSYLSHAKISHREAPLAISS